MALTTGIATDLLTFARSGTKWRFNSAGLMVDVADGVLALDFDPSAADIDEPTLKKRLGASIEGAATEILTYTEDFSNAAWTKQGVTLSADAVVAPDGTTTMDKIVEDSSTGEHRLYQLAAHTTGLAYAYSFFAMKGERTRVGAYAISGRIAPTFDLGAGAVVGGVGYNAIKSLGPHPVTGDTVYRCYGAEVATTTTSSYQQVRLVSSGTTTSYAGDGSSGLYVWGVNFQQVDNPGSYIKRVSAAASRAADSLTITIADIAPWSTTRGVIEVSARAPYGNGLAILWQVDDGSEDDRLRIVRDASGNLRCIATVGGVEQCNLNLGAVARGADFSVAFAWEADDFAASLDGAAAVTDTSGSVPSGLTTMRFGHSFTGEHWNSTVKSVLYSVP